MDHLHKEFDLTDEDVVEVILDHAANVLLIDEANYQHYRAGHAYRYNGGHATASPVRLRPPQPGHWHLVVDLGGYPGKVKAAIRVIGQGVYQGT